MTGFPQGLALGPDLFLISVNDFPHDISSISKMFGDDTSLFSKVKDSSYFSHRKCKQQKRYILAKFSSDDHPKLTFNGI